MSKLTTTQAKVLDFIRSSVERSGVAPTLREICAHMGYSAIGSAQDLVSALRKKGYLEENDRQTARTLVLTPLARHQCRLDEHDSNTYVVPCLGFVPAGSPLDAVENRIGTLRLSIALLPKPTPRPDELFALKATGDSMSGAGILDGDWLVVRVDRDPPKESIVVARVDGAVTVKRLRWDKAKGFYLQPENPRYRPVFAKDESFDVVGRVVALQRAIG